MLVDGSDITFKKSLREVVRGSRCTIFESSSDVAGIGVRDCDQEVRGGLTIGGFKSEIDEVLASEIGRAEINHATFVDEADLVE